MNRLQGPEDFPFPFPPYDIQKDFMRKLFSVLEEGQLGIFESPTGTGKSLSLICGALTWLRLHADHHKAELLRIVEESKNTKEDDGPDWFSAATKRIEEHKEARRCKDELLLLDKQEERIKALKKRSKVAKTHSIQNFIKESNEPTQNLHESDKENLQRLNEANGNDVLPAEEQALLLEDYSSDGEDEEGRLDEVEEEDQGCLKIFYCSRTHSQLSQFVREIQKTEFGKEARVVSLASRQNLCVNETVNKLTNISLINDRCLELRRGHKGKTTKHTQDGTTTKKKRTTSGCPYYTHNTVNALTDKVLVKVQDIEQLVGLGRETKGCPYYAARSAIRDAEVVVLPYNTLLHKPTRDSYNIKLRGNVVIVDEAHNLLETISNIHSVFVSFRQFQGAHAQLSQYLQRYGKRLSPRNLLYIKQILLFMHSIIKMLRGGSKNDSCASTPATSATPNTPATSATPATSNTPATSTSRILTVYDFLVESKNDTHNFSDLVQYIQKSKIAHKLHSFSQHFEGSVKINNHSPKCSSPSTTSILAKLSGKLKPEMPNKSEGQEQEEEEEVVMGSPLMQIKEFLKALSHATADGRVVVTVDTSKPQSSSVKYLLLNPHTYFRDIVTQSRSVIVAGGTMQPISEFQDQLFLAAGGEKERVQHFSCGHVVPAKQLLPVVLPKGPTGLTLDFTYQHRTDPKMLDELGRVLVNVCTVVPGGVVCFLPSYDYEHRLRTHFTSSGVLTRLTAKKKVFWEPKKANQLDSVLNDYSKTISMTASNTSGMSGSLLLSVVGGKMSEGINFSDELGRCVVMVGLPYPNMHSPDLKEKMLYLNKHVSPGVDGKAAGSVFYENLCFKAVNQSIGRAIRHRQDYASILLVDHRYSRHTSIQALPQWISKHLCVTTKFAETFGLLRKFFVEKKSEGIASP